jgi:hypothetical protein
MYLNESDMMIPTTFSVNSHSQLDYQLLMQQPNDLYILRNDVADCVDYSVRILTQRTLFHD